MINNYSFIIIVVLFFIQDSIVHSAYCFIVTHKAKVNSTIISSNSNNCKVIKASKYLRHIMTVIIYDWFKSKTYLNKVPVMANKELMWAISFIRIYPFWDISFILIQHLQFTQLSRANIHLRKFVDIICQPNGKHI